MPGDRQLTQRLLEALSDLLSHSAVRSCGSRPSERQRTGSVTRHLRLPSVGAAMRHRPLSWAQPCARRRRDEMTGTSAHRDAGTQTMLMLNAERTLLVRSGPGWQALTSTERSRRCQPVCSWGAAWLLRRDSCSRTGHVAK